jgi:uncharacterized membrane protein
MTELIYFLGRFHVLVLHLPIGILLLAVLLECMVRRPRFQALEPSVPIVWLAGAVSAVVTVALGYLHTTEGGFDGPGVNWHRWSGSALTLFAFLVWAWRAESPRTYAKGWPVAALGTVGLLIATGHFGGNLTHGSMFLVEYAPAPLQRLAGVPEEHLPRPPVTEIASADIYLDVVAPAFRKRCMSCHNDDKRRGELSLSSYDNLMQGGENGPVIVPRDPPMSELLRRISVPKDHVDFMPKDGKTPLTAQETAAIEWWIAVGAPNKGTLAELKAPEKVQVTIAEALGLPANGDTQAGVTPPPPRPGA